jgi:integrase/recombinase XerD
MTQRRQRMIEDLQLRGLSARTQELYVRAIRPLAEPDHKSPDGITAEELRAYFRSLKNVTHSSRSASTIALCGLKFVSEHTWQRAWTTLTFVRPPREQKLPVILRIAEVRTLLAHLQRLRSRVCLTTSDACGLRLQEGTHRQVPDLDRARMLVHVRGGNGAKARSVPLPQPTLEWLRQSWTTPRHPVWIVPAPGRGGLAMPTATAPRPRSRGPGAFRAALTASGIPKRAAGHTLRPSYATPWLDAGVNRRLIQEDWGHNPPTTPALYTHLTLKAEALAREALNRRMTHL